MADGKIVIKLTTDRKRFAKELSYAERDAQKHFSKVAKLEAKIDHEADKRSRDFHKSAIAQEYRDTKKGLEVQRKLVEKNSAKLQAIRDKYPGIDSLSNFSKKPGVNKGLTTIKANKLGIPLSALSEFELAKSEAGGSKNTYAQMQREFKEFLEPKYKAEKEKLFEPSDKQVELFGDLSSENAELKAAEKNVARLKAQINEIEKKQKIALLFQNIVKHMPHPLVKIQKTMHELNKKMHMFGRRLKYAAVQGLLLRPIRQAFFSIYEAIATATKANSQFSQSLANLKGTLWTAFAPTFEALMPILESFNNYLANMVTYISTLINALFGLSKVSKETAKNLAQSADKEKKDKNFAKWDTVQQLQKKSDKIKPTFEQDFSKAEQDLKGVTDAIKAENWYKVGDEIAKILNGLLQKLDDWFNKVKHKITAFGTHLAEFLNGLIAGTDWDALGSHIANGLNTILQAFDNFLMEFDSINFGAKIAEMINAFARDFDWGLFGKTVVDFFNEIVGFIYGLLRDIDTKQIGKGLGEAFTSAITTIDFGLIGATLSQLVIKAINLLTGFIQGVDWSEVAKALLWGIVNFISNIDVAEITKSLFELIGSAIGGLLAFVGGIAQFITEAVDAAMEIVRQWLVDTFTEDGKLTLNSFLNGMASVLSNIGTWVLENIFIPLWDGFVDAFGFSDEESAKMHEAGQRVIEGFKNGIASGLAGVKAVLNTIISAVESAVNWVIDKINSISFDIPKWIPIAGGKHIGFNVDKVSIPRLAQGTVVNPGRQFAAILGDNRREQEIVSPLSTMQEALSNALRANGAGRSGDVVLQIDGATFARLINPYTQRENNRIGISLVGGD